MRNLVLGGCLVVSIASRAAAQPAATAATQTPAAPDEPLRGSTGITVGLAGCESQIAAKCLEAADLMDTLHVPSRNGQSPSDLRARADELLDQQCTADDAAACFEQGKRLERSGRHGRQADAKVGHAKLARACALKNGDACAMLGDHAGHTKAALGFFEQACAADSNYGCEQLAVHLGPHDRRAADLHHKACVGDVLSGCQHSGELRQARGDRAGAAAEFEAACTLGDMSSCDRTALLTDEPGHARELFERACDADVATGCSHLAAVVAVGKGGTRDWGAAIDLAERACAIDKAARCTQAALLRAHPPDARCSTEEACRRLCDERIAAACGSLAALVANAGPASAGPASAVPTSVQFPSYLPAVGSKRTITHVTTATGTVTRNGKEEPWTQRLTATFTVEALELSGDTITKKRVRFTTAHVKSDAKGHQEDADLPLAGKTYIVENSQSPYTAADGSSPSAKERWALAQLRSVNVPDSPGGFVSGKTFTMGEQVRSRDLFARLFDLSLTAPVDVELEMIKADARTATFDIATKTQGKSLGLAVTNVGKGTVQVDRARGAATELTLSSMQSGKGKLGSDDVEIRTAITTHETTDYK